MEHLRINIYPDGDGSNMIRLDKYLCEMSVGSRSQVKEYIKKGRVKVDNEVVKSADVKIDEDSAIITFDDKVVGYTKVEYYMLNKPAGVVSATTDNRYRTVIDIIDDKKRKDLFPVGRLDIDTEGLLVITNEGDMAHRLLSPKKHVSKVYYARINGPVTDRHIELFKEGLVLKDGTKALPGNLKIINSADESEIELEIFEGKFHQVKKMFEAIDLKVLYLKRISMGKLKLDNTLEIGSYRKLTDEEVKLLNER